MRESNNLIRYTEKINNIVSERQRESNVKYNPVEKALESILTSSLDEYRPSKVKKGGKKKPVIRSSIGGITHNRK